MQFYKRVVLVCLSLLFELAARPTTTAATTTAVIYNGCKYRTLLEAYVNGAGRYSSAEQTYTPMPVGYSVAPDDQDIVDNVIAPYYWDVWRLCTESKAWGTKHYGVPSYNMSAGIEKDSVKKWENNGNDYRIIPGRDYYRLLIRAVTTTTTTTTSTTTAIITTTTTSTTTTSTTTTTTTTVTAACPRHCGNTGGGCTLCVRDGNLCRHAHCTWVNGNHKCVDNSANGQCYDNLEMCERGLCDVYGDDCCAGFATSTTSTTTTITTTTDITAVNAIANATTATTATGSASIARTNALTTTTPTLVVINTLNTSAEPVETSKGGGGGTAAAVVVTFLMLAVAVGGYVWHDRRSKQQQQQQEARDAVLGGGEMLEMIENPLRRRTNDGAGAGGAAAVGALPADATSAGAGAPIYDPPAGLPPAQESPGYYSDVAAAPGTVAEYAVLNELDGHTVYGGGGGGGVGGGAAAYASPTEGRGAVYVDASSGTAAAYASTTNASGMYAPSGGVVGADDGALYTNDAHGNVPGSTV